jgi:hypothetical protein
LVRYCNLVWALQLNYLISIISFNSLSGNASECALRLARVAMRYMRPD